MAKFFLDENLPTSLCETLRDLGHECKHVRDVGLTGASDEIIAEYAKSKTLILVTKDVEFGNILLYPPHKHHGLVVVRLPHTTTADHIKNAISLFLQKIDPKILIHAIPVVETGKYRIRKNTP